MPTFSSLDFNYQETLIASARVTASKSHSGSNSLALGECLEGIAGYSGVAQTVTTVAGASTTFSFWALFEPEVPSAPTNTIRVYIDNTLAKTWDNQNPTGWTQYSFVFTPTSASTRIAIDASVRMPACLGAIMFPWIHQLIRAGGTSHVCYYRIPTVILSMICSVLYIEYNKIHVAMCDQLTWEPLWDPSCPKLNPLLLAAV